ncbi:MAG: hypothetical protein WBC50_10270 [Dehalococcoidales bacterium]
MQKRKIMMMMVVLVFLAGCAYNIGLVDTTYKMLKGSQISYDTAMKVAADLYRQGRITDREKETITAVGTVYSDAHNTAVRALADYQRTKDLADQERMSAQIEIATRALSKLLELLTPYLEG